MRATKTKPTLKQLASLMRAADATRDRFFRTGSRPLKQGRPAGTFSVDQEVFVITTDCKPQKIMKLQIHHETSGVRVRLVDGAATSWWEYIEPQSV